MMTEENSEVGEEDEEEEGEEGEEEDSVETCFNSLLLLSYAIRYTRFWFPYVDTVLSRIYTATDV